MNDFESQLSRTTKIGVVAVLISLFVFDFYWTRDSWSMVLGYLNHEPEAYQKVTSLAFWGADIGLTSRLIGVAIALIAITLIWLKGRPFSKIKGLLATALVLESVYIAGFLPTFWFLVRPTNFFGDSTPISPFFFLGLNYQLQIIVAVPFLLILAFKIYRYRGSVEQKLGLQKWAGIAFVGYIAALGINSVFRWLDMLWSAGLVFLVTGVRAVGFLDSVILMPLAVAFAVVGAYRMGKQKVTSAFRWFGLALISVGLCYTVYVIYSYWVGALKYAMLVDVWTVPLLGLGVALLINSRKHIIQS